MGSLGGAVKCERVRQIEGHFRVVDRDSRQVWVSEVKCRRSKGKYGRA